MRVGEGGTVLTRWLLRVVVIAAAAAAAVVCIPISISQGRHPLSPDLQHHQGRPQVWVPRMQSFLFKKECGENNSHIGEQPNFGGETSLASLSVATSSE